MAVSRAMRRLLGLFQLEEEQSRAVLEAAVADLRRLESALDAAQEGERRGRRMVALSACTGELVDRLAGIEETLAACRHATALNPMIAQTERSVAMRRQEFFDKRIERRRAETLIAKVEAVQTVEAGRRAQRETDDRFLSRAHKSADKVDRG